MSEFVEILNAVTESMEASVDLLPSAIEEGESLLSLEAAEAAAALESGVSVFEDVAQDVAGNVSSISATEEAIDEAVDEMIEAGEEGPAGEGAGPQAKKIDFNFHAGQAAQQSSLAMQLAGVAGVGAVSWVIYHKFMVKEGLMGNITRITNDKHGVTLSFQPTPDSQVTMQNGDTITIDSKYLFGDVPRSYLCVNLLPSDNQLNCARITSLGHVNVSNVTAEPSPPDIFGTLTVHTTFATQVKNDLHTGLHELIDLGRDGLGDLGLWKWLKPVLIAVGVILGLAIMAGLARLVVNWRKNKADPS